MTHPTSSVIIRHHPHHPHLGHNVWGSSKPFEDCDGWETDRIANTWCEVLSSSCKSSWGILQSCWMASLWETVWWTLALWGPEKHISDNGRQQGSSFETQGLMASASPSSCHHHYHHHQSSQIIMSSDPIPIPILSFHHHRFVIIIVLSMITNIIRLYMIIYY